MYLEVGIFPKQLLKYITQVVTVITFFAARRRVIIAVVHFFTDHLKVSQVLLQSLRFTFFRPYFLPQFIACAQSASDNNDGQLPKSFSVQ